MCMFCRSLFVLLYLFFWPLCCLFFYEIRILITSLLYLQTLLDMHVFIARLSVYTVALAPYPFMVLFFFFLLFFWRTIELRISPYQKFAELRQEFVAPFNSNFHNKTLCESGVMWITRFVTYLSIAFHIYLLNIIHV
jgi:energy-coupling factor transporter transmembrane protein EcfT